jgi:uncharacterized membrane protein YhaH (DUF805 family)
MLFFLIGLLVALIAVVLFANSRKKAGAMSESTHQTVISVCSIVVTIAALGVLVMRLRAPSP